MFRAAAKRFNIKFLGRSVFHTFICNESIAWPNFIAFSFFRWRVLVFPSTILVALLKAPSQTIPLLQKTCFFSVFHIFAQNGEV